MCVNVRANGIMYLNANSYTMMTAQKSVQGRVSQFEDYDVETVGKKKKVRHSIAHDKTCVVLLCASG